MPAEILIIDDEVALGKSLQSVLEQEGYSASLAVTGEEGLRLVDEKRPRVAICDIRLPDCSGLEILERISQTSPNTQVIMITAYATLESAIGALKLGARDYLIKPFLFDDMLHRIERVLSHQQLEREAQYLRRSLSALKRDWEIVGESAGVRKLRTLIERVAATNSTALITGESGCGKELVARAIHRLSPRADGPFLAINCSAIPDTLLESELFGYSKGAFSGADTAKEGLAQLADGGTLLLDEVGDLPVALQPKLLRFLETMEFFPLGSTQAAKVSTRILSASNRNVKGMIEDGKFREDLYYRLNLIEIAVPPLRDRVEDIPLLIDHMLDRFNRELGRRVNDIAPHAMAELCEKPWPGNVRELENVIQRAMILTDGEVLTSEVLFPDRVGGRPADNASLRDAVRSFERSVIRDAIARNDGDKRRAAEQLGISVASLYAKLQSQDANNTSSD